MSASLTTAFCLSSITPMDATSFQPKVRAAPISQPDRWLEARQPFGINGQVPTWSNTRNQEQLNILLAPAWASHADTPVLLIISRQNSVPKWNAIRQAIPLDYMQATKRQKFGLQAAPPEGISHGCAPALVVVKNGKPSSGSREPCPRMAAFASNEKSLSGVYSSSQAARLNCVLAYS